jgi:hypothetical protein
MRIVVWIFAATTIVSGATVARGQTAQAPAAAVDADELDTDSDPTRPVFFSIRPEFYNPSAGVTQEALIFRLDRASLGGQRWLPGRRGVLLRFEVPLVETHAAGLPLQAGLGDAYAQILAVPYLTRSSAFLVGTGVLAPSASDNLLGAGKWVLAPVAAPVWFFARRGMFFVKFQNFASFAGESGRPDVNYLLITPTFIHAVLGRWWVLADSEAKTNWLMDSQTSVKSGLQVGRRLNSGLAFWVKPEFYWGARRDGTWNLKFGLVWYRSIRGAQAANP